MISASPSVCPQRQPDFDVQVFGQYDQHFGWTYFGRSPEFPRDELDTGRLAQVGVGHVEVGRVEVKLIVDIVLRELVEDRQEVWVDDLAVSHLTGVHQLRGEYPRRRFIRLRGQVEHEPFRPRGESAGSFHEHLGGVRVFAE
ncbi:hypothetical protein D3C72_1402270 [compost metagenome]